MTKEKLIDLLDAAPGDAEVYLSPTCLSSEFHALQLECNQFGEYMVVLYDSKNNTITIYSEYP